MFTWTKILQYGLKAVAAFLDVIRNRQLLNAGKATQRADDAEARGKANAAAASVEQRVDGASDAELDSLRDKWTRK